MADPTFEEIAAALYAGAPEAFVASRKAQADGVADPEFASRIRALRKPSVAAWVVNVFAQERAGQLGEALQLAAELREAQDDLDASCAWRSSAGSAEHFTRRLAEIGGRVGRFPRRADHFCHAGGGGRQHLGRVLRPRRRRVPSPPGGWYEAIEPTASTDDIRDAVAGDIPELKPVPQRPSDELQARRLRREAERQRASAEKEKTAAERELERRDVALRDLQGRATELAERVSELEAELARTRAEAERVGEELLPAKERRADAAKRAEAAADAADRARPGHRRAVARSDETQPRLWRRRPGRKGSIGARYSHAAASSGSRVASACPKRHTRLNR